MEQSAHLKPRRKFERSMGWLNQLETAEQEINASDKERLVHLESVEKP
jgi:hypothetical protein